MKTLLFKPFLILMLLIFVTSTACQIGIQNPLAQQANEAPAEGPDLEATVSAKLTEQAPKQEFLQPTQETELQLQTQEPVEITMEPGDGGGGSDGWITLTDETGHISMDVPAEWADIDTTLKEWQLMRTDQDQTQELKEPIFDGIKGEDLFKVPRIEASTNLAEFRKMFYEDQSVEVEPTGYNAPGVRLTLSDVYGKRIPYLNLFTMRERLPKDTEGRQCEYISNPTGKPFDDYSKKTVAGVEVDAVYSLWKNCGGFGGPMVAVLAARPHKSKDIQKWGLLLEIQAPADYDRNELRELMDKMVYSIKILQEF